MAQCIFCASVASSREHLWSDWINGILPKSTYTFKKVDAVTKRERVWEDDELNVKSKLTCIGCNTGWMSRVENDDAKPSLGPLIRGTSARVIPIRLLISIGIFLFMKSVVADHVGTGGDPFFTIEERYSFRNELSIPSGLSMWIGALEDSSRGTFKTLHVVPRAATENDFGLYIFTFVVGHLVLQLVGAKWATHNLRTILPPKQRESDSDYMTWFWPITSSVRWPPPKYIPVSLLDNLTNRWKTYSIA